MDHLHHTRQCMFQDKTELHEFLTPFGMLPGEENFDFRNKFPVCCYGVNISLSEMSKQNVDRKRFIFRKGTSSISHSICGILSVDKSISVIEQNIDFRNKFSVLNVVE